MVGKWLVGGWLVGGQLMVGRWSVGGRYRQEYVGKESHSFV